MNDIIFVKGQGGLGRPLAGEDHITGLVFFTDNPPSGFASENVKQIFSVAEAEALGILDDKSDEIKATGGNVLITTVGAVGTIWTVAMNGTTLGTYTVITDDDASDVAVGLRAAINAGTSGYAAAGLTANVLLTAPAGLGDSINTGLTGVNSGAGAATITQFSGGVDAFYDVIHYHISEYFRMQPNGELWVMIAEEPTGDCDFTELQTLQNAAEGKVRQAGVYLANIEAFSTDQVTAAQAVAETLESEHKPLSIILASDFADVDDLTNLSDLKALDAEKVSVVIGEDGDNDGAALYTDKGFSITCLGALMGTISLAAVHENIGWVKKFNVANDELDVPALALGLTDKLTRNLTSGQISGINTKGYIFLVKHSGITGSYFNDSFTATLGTSDYCYLENNRVIDKAIRGIRTYMLPELNGPVTVDPQTGLLQGEYVKFLEGLGNRALEEMEKAGEISGASVVIDPRQNVLSTSRIEVVVMNVPVGVSRTISIKIGFTTKL